MGGAADSSSSGGGGGGGDNECVQALAPRAAALRDHLARHARPATVRFQLDTGGGVKTLQVAAAIGDDPAEAAARAAEEHGLSSGDARRLAAALKERQWPFDYAAMCGAAGRR